MNTRAQAVSAQATHARLYYYTDWQNYAWAANPEHFRKLTGLRGPYCVRVAHVDVAAPDGYRKGTGELALDAVERVPTMREFVRGLSPCR